MSEVGSTETIIPSDVGVPPGAPLPFEFRPGLRASPLVVSFPHVGLEWPASLGPRPQVNFPRNADYAVDRLYIRAETLGAATVRARYSRLVVDLNRADDDVSPEFVPDHPAPRPRPTIGATTIGNVRRKISNRGVVWRSAVGNIPLLTTLTHAQLSNRLERYYWPYHRALEVLVERRRRRFGYAIVLDAHSMPGTVAGDLVLGTRSGSACSPDLCALAVRSLSGLGDRQRGRFGSRWPLSLSIDDPYRGGHITGTFGRPEADVHGLQLEISRGLYMDEYRLELSPLPTPGDLAQLGSSPSRSRPAHTSHRDRRRLLALVGALDSLVMDLSLARDELAGRTAAE